MTRGYAVAEGGLGGALEEGGGVFVGHGLVVYSHLREAEVQVEGHAGLREVCDCGEERLDRRLGHFARQARPACDRRRVAVEDVHALLESRPLRARNLHLVLVVKTAQGLLQAPVHDEARPRMTADYLTLFTFVRSPSDCDKFFEASNAVSWAGSFGFFITSNMKVPKFLMNTPYCEHSGPSPPASFPGCSC